jgi:hypothetical protein
MWRHAEGMLWLTTLGSLILAAIVSAKALLILLGVVALVATAVALPLHFVRLWRRLGSVRNKREFAVWGGIELLFAVGLIAVASMTVSR